jgi:sulfate adenylyltransferase subunit 1
VDNDAVILIRDRKVFDIIPISAYQYGGLPVLDERGFALRIRGAADLDNFLYEHKNTDKEKYLEFHNKWSKFETYRKIVFTDNFWMI